nr:MAG TPA: hypothetical protein [Caudoviricetes sp.]DAQ06392.1 MAG TPA: hypothetical protein [Caudoviricetes sp.]
MFSIIQIYYSFTDKKGTFTELFRKLYGTFTEFI